MEVGTHQDLLKDASGMYAKLVRKQMLTETEVPVVHSGHHSETSIWPSGGCHGSGKQSKEDGKEGVSYGTR